MVSTQEDDAGPTIQLILNIILSNSSGSYQTLIRGIVWRSLKTTAALSGVSRCCCAPGIGAYRWLAGCGITQQPEDYVSNIFDPGAAAPFHLRNPLCTVCTSRSRSRGQQHFVPAAERSDICLGCYCFLLRFLTDQNHQNHS